MALKGKQKNIDANKDGRISGEDFKILRSRQRGGMKKKMMGGGLTAATQKLKSQGKMGGGMMMKPIMANKGKNITGKISAAVKEFYDTVPPNKDPRMTGAKYRKYLRGLKQASSKSLITQLQKKGLTTPLNKTALKYFKNIGVFPAVSGAKKIIDNSSAKDFVQRRIALGGGRAGLILKGAAAVAKALKKLKPSKKMGGGMMMKPIMADKGLMATAGKTAYKKLMEQRAKDRKKDRDEARAADITKGMGGYMGGGMMNMPGYKKGKSVMAKGCKLGRKKPTKMYT